MTTTVSSTLHSPMTIIAKAWCGLSFVNKDDLTLTIAARLCQNHSQIAMCTSEILDTDYYIEYHDNSRGLISGPSDWDIIVAVKVNINDITLWIHDIAEISYEQINTRWWDDF